MDMAGQETLAGITGHRYSTLEDLLEEERDSELGDGCVLIALHDGYPAGFSCQDILYDDFYSGEERSLFATVLFVDPDHRRQGVASSLMGEQMALARRWWFSRIYARVRADNEPMLNMMSRRGWNPVLSTISMDLQGRDRRGRGRIGPH